MGIIPIIYQYQRYNHQPASIKNHPPRCVSGVELYNE
jgi:hypothetical protein